MAGLNQRFRVSSNKITLPRAFAEQHGAAIAQAYKTVSDVINMDGRYPSGNELKDAVQVAVKMPYAGLALVMPFQDKHGRLSAMNRASLGTAVITLARASRMVFDPKHAQFCRDLISLMGQAQTVCTDDPRDMPKLQGPGAVAIRKMALGS